MKMTRKKANSPEAANTSTPSPPTLAVQYRIAVELYRHEDNLNWTKLNHLFYINAGLWAVMGFIAQSNGTKNGPLPIDPRLLMLTVSFIGMIACFALGVALWFGIKYMLNRKNAVIRIEERLIKHGGNYIVSSKSDIVSSKSDTPEKSGFLEISPTTWMLRLVPIVLFIVWAILFGWIILNWLNGSQALTFDIVCENANS